MTPIFFDSSCNNYSSYPSDHYEDNLNNHQFLSPNSQPSSSSTSFATHLFLNSNHQTGIFNPELQPPQHQHEGDNFGSQAYKDHRIENRNGKEVEFSTWNNSMSNDLHQVKWMSSKMRVMLKMKKSVDHVNPNTYTTIEATNKLEDHKLPTSPPMEETDNSSNDNSSNSTSSNNNNNNIPIRVCSDCNTTKTPLWRSGPRGPKSLCNACGIRQRKARRAMTAAAAAAENGNSNIFNGQSLIAPLKVKKIQHKDHKKAGKGYVTKYKKRQYLKQPSPPPPPVLVSSPCGAPSLSPSSSPSPSLSPSPSPARRNCVEEFLASLSRNLAFYHVFPQDEKEAAILLMALSCGYAHET